MAFSILNANYIDKMRMRKLRLLIPLFYLLLTIVGPAAAAGQYTEVNLAIIDFEGIGITSDEAAIVSDKFRYALIENSRYKIMERSEISAILKEQGFQQTGACNSTSCMVEVGQLLGVHYLIAGRVGRASGILAFSARLIDVATGTIITAASFESNNDFMRFLSINIPEYSKTFVGKVQQSLEDISRSSQTGMLFVESKPSNGEVFIDGETTGKASPVTLSNIKVGKHSITVRLKDLIGSAEVDIQPGQISKPVIAMNRGLATIVVTTTPVNADIYIDNQFIGKSPVVKDSLPAGSHTLTAKNKGYETASESIFLNAMSRSERLLTLPPLAYISIRILPETSGTMIRINGKPAKFIGQNIIETYAGEPEIEIRKTGFYGKKLVINIKQMDTLSLTVTLTPIDAMLFVTSIPESAGFSITGPEGRIKEGLTPSDLFTLKPARYSIECNLRKYDTIKHLIDLKPGQKFSVCDTFKTFSAEYRQWLSDKKEAGGLNWGLAGLGEIKMKKYFSGYPFLTLDLISDATFCLSAYQLFSHYQQAQASTIATSKTYYQKRQLEDGGFLIGSLIVSLTLRYIASMLTDGTTF